eukprot:m.144696 g.144696  ORF g.144696 m.144696 type:complete len:710 (-) comp17202_c0_seq1:136-2265(-)
MSRVCFMAAVAVAAVARVCGETLDVLEPLKAPPSVCANGCARWGALAADGNHANQTAVNLLWRNHSLQKSAGAVCAQPGLSPFKDGSTVGGYSGAYCFCKGPLQVTDTVVGYCESKPGVPEQINLQVSAPDTLVASFVTFGPQAAGAHPQVQVSEDPSLAGAKVFEGVTHTYLSPSSDGGKAQPVRSYNMHFVVLSGLKERTRYFYRVAPHKPADPNVPNATSCHGWTCSVEGEYCPPNVPGATQPSGDRCCSGKWIPGTAACASPWSSTLSFRSLYTAGETRIAIFGDMGMMSDGNTVHGNLLRDAEAGAIDAFVHMGDHAYQMSSDDDRRGDGYMNAYQPLAGTVPWLPVIGNHEYYDNAFFHRFLNQSYGVQLGRGPVKAPFCGHQNGCASQEDLMSRHPTLDPEDSITADSALGTLLARTKMVASSSRKSGPVPSNTSRWYSTEIGLVHLIALDMMVYPGATPDPGPAPGVYLKAQREWLEADLAAIDRKKTPWVLAFAHHPLYCSSITMGTGTVEFGEDGLPADHAADVLSELTPEQKLRVPPGKHYKGCTGTGELFVELARASLEPLFLQYGVDMFLAGHEHDYESVWPVKHCAMGSPRCYIGDSFDEPKAPVHVVCGEGGTNGGDHFGDNWGPWTRKQLGQDTPGECTTLNSGGSTQGGCSAGYGRITAHNESHLTYEYVLNVNGTVWDSWTVHQPNHGPFE